MCRRALSYRAAKHANRVSTCKCVYKKEKAELCNYLIPHRPTQDSSNISFQFLVYKNAEDMGHLGKLETNRLKENVKISLRESGVKMWTRFHCLWMGLSGWLL
jgi:hypothetical protein